MKQLRSINIIEDKKTARKLSIRAVLLMFPFYFFFQWLSFLLPTLWDDFPTLERSFLIDLLLLFVLLILHELIHALFFKIFAPENKVRFGFKNGLAYAASPGTLYSKGKYLWISLAPFVFITLGLILAYLGGMISSSLYVFFCRDSQRGLYRRFLLGVFTLARTEKQLCRRHGSRD